MKKGKKKKWIIIAVIISIPLLLFYGPFPQFRILWINTAMGTSNYKFLATMLYTDSYIKEVLEDNLVTTDKKTDSEMINIDKSENISFGNINGDYYSGYLLKIDDPSRIGLALTEDPKGKLLEEIVAEHNAIGGINASGYVSEKTRGITWGYCIFNGEVVCECADGTKHTMGGMDYSNKFIVGTFTPEEIKRQNFKWAVEFGPILVVNGEKTDIKQSAGGMAPRTAIGQTQNGAILLLVVDGRQLSSIGATYADLQTILYANGAVNAIVLDGGSSSSMVNEGKLINNPSDGDSERLLPNAIIFK